MAATGKTPILLYGSTTATNTPSAGNLTNSADGCEIAINVADKNLFFKDSTNAVNTVPIRQSSASSNGWLSSTDWSTFNSKQPAGTYVTSVTGTAPVVSSGGTTPAISMAAATGSVNGYLTSTDWTTFNGKQAALVSGTNIKTVSGTTLLGSGDLGTIGTGYGGTGLTSFTANGVVYASSTSALTTGTKLVFDGTNLGVNTTPTTQNGATLCQVGAATCLMGTSTITYLANNIVYNSGYKYIKNGYSTMYTTSLSDGNSTWYTSATGSAGAAVTGLTASMTLFQSGGLSIGNTTDPGATNLSVSGNVVIATSGKGIDFSATPQPSGMTSELLADYEEGTFTPTISSNVGTITSYTTANCAYTKTGRVVIINGTFTITNNGTGDGQILISNLPYSILNSQAGGTARETAVDGKTSGIRGNSSSALIMARYDNTYPGSTNASFQFSVTYFN